MRNIQQEDNRIFERLKELEDYQYKYQSLINNFPVIIYTADLNDQSGTSYVNRYAEEITGFTYEEFTEEPGLWEQRLHPDDRERVLEELKVSRENDVPFISEYRFLHKDGHVIWLYDKAVIVKDDEGNPLFLHGVMNDISERKSTELKLRKFTKVIEQSPSSIVITDIEGNIEYINPKFIELTGYTEEELIGENPRVLQSGHQGPEFYENMWRTLTGGAVWKGELCNKKKNGDIYWEAAAIAPLLNDKGEISNYIGIKEDITEKKQLERLKGDVERITRHDLKSPLNSIINLPQLIKEEGEVNDIQMEFLDIIEESGYRMLAIINGSLDLFKMEQGTYQLRAKSLDLIFIIKRVLSDVMKNINSHSLNFEIRIKDAEEEQGKSYTLWPLSDQAKDLQYRVYGEELLLFTMMGNLLDNAIEASPRRGKITITLVKTDREDRISVHNFGEISSEVRDNFFEKYATAGKSRGTGLGTYSAKLIAETHGGSISFRTSSEEGTTIHVRLPGGRNI